MFQPRSAVLALLALTLMMTACGDEMGIEEAAPVRVFESSTPQVTLAGPYTSLSWDMRDGSQRKFDLPVLFLHRGREATAADQRTLTIDLSGVAAGELQLELTSHHVNVATGAPHTLAQRIAVVDSSGMVQWTLDPSSTLSDFYHLRVKDAAGAVLWENPQRPALVALDTWDVAFGEFVMRVYYANLFPFAKGQNDLNNRLQPEAVTNFIECQFIPIIQETWHTQVEVWGFGQPFHPAWDADGFVEVIITDGTFALFGETGTYSLFTGYDGQPYPERRIWWFSSNNSFQVYDSLENAYKAVLAHEFFHLMQWNVLLSTGSPSHLWISVIEAQGRMAPTVQYPELELSRDHLVLENSSYTQAAERFLGQHLNTSYRELEANRGNKYDAALYWRFLYEQYHGMVIIRAALEEMAHHYSTDPTSGLRGATDAAFARVGGPFDSFEESLIAFAQANYALGLETGRCTSPDLTHCNGRYYDPEGMYADPPLEAELHYGGAAHTYRGTIPTSYGMDFIEAKLDPAARGQTLRLWLTGDEAATRFHVQVWPLQSGYAKPRPATPVPATLTRDESGAFAYVVSDADVGQYDRLALIITRVDPNETVDTAGNYQITLEPAAVAETG